MEPKSILFVEDDPNDVELTLTALAEHHLSDDIHWLRDGAEAVDYLYRRGPFTNRPAGNPVVIVLDIKMPKVDGLTVLRQIRADAQLHLIPVVILTSSREERDVLDSYKLGINAYVVKPMGLPAFTNAVKELGLFWAVINEPPPGSVKRPSV
ncbi:MAG: response regulator [Anaerolineales bacterium]